MSGPLTHAPAEVMQRLLIALGACADPDVLPLGAWPVYEGTEPDSPDNCVTLGETQGRGHGSSMIDGERFEHYGFQVRVRSADKPVGSRKARDLALVIDKQTALKHVVIEAVDYLVYKASRTDQPVWIGMDKPNSRRHLFTFNVIVALRVAP